jgi:uncharacterized damage-inducible protein DinB
MEFAIDQLDENLLLEQWRWLCAERATLVARNGFGDLFLRTVEGEVLWLNVGSGTLAEVADSESSFEDLLRQSAKRELWLAEQQLETFADRGLKPNDLHWDRNQDIDRRHIAEVRPLNFEKFSTSTGQTSRLRSSSDYRRTLPM